MGIFHLNLWITICADTLVNFLNMLLMSIMGPHALKVSFYYSIHTGKKKKLLEENKEEGRERGGIVQLKKPPKRGCFCRDGASIQGKPLHLPSNNPWILDSRFYLQRCCLSLNFREDSSC